MKTIPFPVILRMYSLKIASIISYPVLFHRKNTKMEALYHQTNKMVHEIQDGLGRVERASENDMHVVENEVSWLAAVCMMCVSLSCISITVHVFSINFCT